MDPIEDAVLADFNVQEWTEEEWQEAADVSAAAIMVDAAYVNGMIQRQAWGGPLDGTAMEGSGVDAEKFAALLAECVRRGFQPSEDEDRVKGAVRFVLEATSSVYGGDEDDDEDEDEGEGTVGG